MSSRSNTGIQLQKAKDHGGPQTVSSPETDRDSGTNFGLPLVTPGLANCTLATNMQRNHTAMLAAMQLIVRCKQSTATKSSFMFM